MSADQFHLAWFYSKGWGPKAWRHSWSGPRSAIARFTKPDTPVDLARSMERSGFDFLMFEDSTNVAYTYQNSHDTYLRYAVDTPKLDPMVAAPFVAAATDKLGVIVTCSTTEYHPFMLARAFNSLDHATDGRIGWNVVTSFNDGSAQNYGRDTMIPHNERYVMADEFMQAAQALWRSWDEDALVLDLENEIFADGSKVHPVNFEGKYFRTRGPLSAPRSPQTSPVICQAGASQEGRNFASVWAETIICPADTPEAMKAYRDDVRAGAAAVGRDPNSVKVLYLVSPIIDETREAAEIRAVRQQEMTEYDIEYALAALSRNTNIDFSQFAWDEPLPRIEGGTSSALKLEGQLLRDVLVNHTQNWTKPEYVGTASDVASYMDEVMSYVGGDGFLFVESYFSRRYTIEICDGLVPELQKRGLTRQAYEHSTLRENLMAF